MIKAEVIELIGDKDMRIKILEHNDKNEISWTYSVKNSTEYFGLITDKVIKKSNLQGGDIITYRNGKVRVVDIKNERIVYLDDFDNNSFYFNKFTEDLMYDKKTDDEWDIVEVYRPTTKETFRTERAKEVKKMTVNEICKELGYDVEIVKEEN